MPVSLSRDMAGWSQFLILVVGETETPDVIQSILGILSTEHINIFSIVRGSTSASRHRHIVFWFLGSFEQDGDFILCDVILIN